MIRAGSVGLALVWLLSSVAPLTAQNIRSKVMPSEGLDAESAALLLSQEDGGDLPLRATMFVAPDEGAGGTGLLTVLLEMNRSDLGLAPAPESSAGGPEAEPPDPVRLDVFLYQLDAGLGVVGSHIRVVQIEPTGAGFVRRPGGADGRFGSDSGRLRYLTQVPVGEGVVEARVLVRARRTRRAALRRRPVGAVGSWPVLPIVTTRSLPTIVDGAFPASLLDWARSSVLVVGAEAEARSAGDSASGTTGQGWTTIAESTESTESAEPSEPESPLVAAVRLGSDGASAQPEQLAVQVWAADDSTQDLVWSGAISAEPGTSEPAGGWIHIPLTPPLAELAPGRYRLMVQRADTQAAPMFQEILVRSDVDVSATPFVGEGRRLAIPARELATGTLTALQALLEGDEAGALRQLSAVENRAIAGSGERLDAARAAQVRGLVRVARTPDLLLPAIDLYLRAYRDRRASRDFLLTTHAREITLALLDQYLRSDDAEPAEAARFLAALARARSPGPSDGSIPLLEWAIELDDEVVDAVWLRAAVAESGGDIEDAVRWWRLASERSDEREIRLHLGIALLRSEGRRARREGREILGALVDQQDWLAQGARAELARDAARRGELAEAIAWSNVADAQSDPSLQVMRSYLAYVQGEDHDMLSYGDAGHRGQEAVPARRRYATAWQRRDVHWSAPEDAAARLLARLRQGGW